MLTAQQEEALDILTDFIEAVRSREPRTANPVTEFVETKPRYRLSGTKPAAYGADEISEDL